MTSYYDDGHRPPRMSCKLPEPVRDPEQLMQTATCQHGTLFLLVDRLDGEEWLEAEPYWTECDRLNVDEYIIVERNDPHDYHESF